MESNLIYRDVTVALLKQEEYPCENDYDEGFMAALDKAIWIVEKYTASAQPEKRTDKRMETHACDCIERQAAIDALAKIVPYAICDESSDSYTNGLTDAYNLICQLPSAQPEPLTDKEQRIFLAAMGREEKVCEEVDRNHVREPYEDSLMRVCKEIRRKVKGALWT